ncbi:hypothetical protein Ahy_B09g095120 [Arachis hypogaea]|uniref:F-box domain-containing protein n=1 Tax=Arachis hypogaea TaxID=3818 RepID=A0A444XDS7_ARAHY|nr:hypothetical protein Ahy_B09g095120 [Arachis hypogaea]
MDRLTSLPKVIILDDILTRLPYKDAARTSVLSKEWKDTWYSFPILSICSKDFFSMHDVLLKNPLRFSNQDILIHYVTKRLLKLLDQGLAIKVFKLNMQCVDHKKMSYHVDLWMKMVSENGVQELELCLPLPTAYVAKGCTIDQEYDLPLCVIEAKSLTKLVLRGKIRFHQQAFLNHSIKLFSVRILHLCEIEQILSQIQVSSTPPTIKRLGLQCVPQNEALYFPYVNWLLLSCCPRTIIFILHSDYDRKPFILFLYELLMGRKKWKWFHHFSDTKCWWHELENVKVTSSFKVHENVDLETMLHSFPKSDGEEYISFSLEL